MRHDLETEIAELVGDSKSTLASLEGRLLIARLPKSSGHIDESLPQPTLIAQSLGELFGFSHVRKELSQFSNWNQRRAQVKAQVDGLLAHFTTLGEMGEGLQRLLKVRHRLPIGRTCQRLGPRLPTVEEHLLPHLAA